MSEGSHIDMVYIYVPALWGVFGIAMGLSVTEPKFKNWVYFHCSKKHQIWEKLGAFLSKRINTDGWVIRQKIGI